MFTGRPASRMFTPARVIALALIAVMVFGLVQLRFAPDGNSMSVPVGAQAGDVVLDPCDYATEKGSYAADCGTLVVPENRADRRSRLIALPLTRIRATSDQPSEPIFILKGGPGMTNMDFEYASRYAENHDVVLVGYRGVDGSERLDCPEVKSAMSHASDFNGEEFYRAQSQAYQVCADRLTGDGVDLASYGLVQQVDDLEAARAALGYERINLLSESAGTRTAMIYGLRYPKSIHRSVMFGVNPPGNFLYHSRTTNEQIQRYADLCSQDPSCSARTGDLAETIRQTSAEIPDRWLGLPIKDANVRIFSFFGLMESTPKAFPIAGPTIVDTWLSATEGDASGFWIASVLNDLLFPELFVRGQYAAAATIDASAARDYFSTYGREDALDLAYATTAMAWGGGKWLDVWPASTEADEYSELRTSKVETLLIGGELDFSTPPQVAKEELLPYLPNGRQVVLPGLGHTGSFFTVQPEANSRLINTFFASGRVDDSLYKARKPDFTPSMGLADIAKIVAGAMAGLALLTVLSLLWMARRVRRRGGFGNKSGALLRSVYAVVLGLGGWLLGALIVLMTMPAVPLTDQLLVTLSTGIPIAMGIYLAWVHRDWSASTKTMGMLAAGAGSLMGAWLGFNPTLTSITAIGGAIAGANLALILLDMSRVCSVTKEPSTLLEVPEGAVGIRS